MRQANLINTLVTYLPFAQSFCWMPVVTKTYSKAFASMGFDVTGIDLAENMISDARHFETDKLHFISMISVATFSVNYFDYAFNLFTSFRYFKLAGT